MPLTFSGFTNVILSKGKDGFGGWTKTEVLSSQPLDIGKIVANKPTFVDLFVGYKYWLNKSGNDSRPDTRLDREHVLCRHCIPRFFDLTSPN